MGWSTNVDTTLYFNKQTYNDKYEVESEIEEHKEYIEDAKQSLLMLASMNPKDLITKDCEGNEFDTISSIKYKFKDIIDEYENSLFKVWKLEQLNKDWHKRSGDFVKHYSYYRYIGKESFIFTPNTLYGVNVNKEWDGSIWYYVDNPIRGEFYKICQEELDKYFEQVTEEEFNKHY